VWTQEHKYFHIAFFIIGLAGSAWYFFYFIDAWLWMLAPIMLTFLYSAPKLPYKIFSLLKKVAIGKTLFLAFVWTYVTAVLPAILNTEPFQLKDLIFCASRFFLIYAICILFDYRDRENDRREGIRSMITYFSESGINALFWSSIIAFFASTISLYFFEFSMLIVACLILPGIIVALLFNQAKRNFSDYLYYFVLDGLMMFSSALTLLQHL
jgi:4-hydroxybenzoate polyprenyltransferase